MYFLYSVLTAAGMLLLLPYFVVQGLRRGKYLHNLRERLGYLPDDFPRASVGRPGSIWVHAVSVGEALAARPLARRLKQRFPSRPLYVSTTTATGQRLARERMEFADGVFYFPLDWAGPVRRALRAVEPALVVILETEIWPNFLREARRGGVPVVFVNGRISERSYGRYRRVNGLVGGFLGQVLRDGTLFLMQSEADAGRLRSLGAPAERVEVTGNLKYDLVPPARSALVEWLGGEVRGQGRRPVVVAGSVVADEEHQVLAGFEMARRKWPRALLVLAPRKPERFDAAASIATGRGWQVARRSRLSLEAPLEESAEVLLLDTVGELAALYALADATFVGGSLVPSGGHNILEPAWFGKPPVFGPSMENFREMAAQFLEAGAGMQVATGEELGRAWVELIENGARREEMGAAARRLVESNRGATDRALERIAGLLEGAAGAGAGGPERRAGPDDAGRSRA